MQNAHIGSKTVRVSTAQQKRSTTQTPAPSQEELQWQQQYPGYDYQSYYAAWQNYHAQNQYYGYDQHYGTYGTTYQYAQQYSYGDVADTTTATVVATPTTSTTIITTMTTTTTTTTAAAAAASASQPTASSQSETEYSQSSYEVPDNTIVEHDIPLDIDQMNQELMQKNEDLYTALEESRWLPVDGLNPPLIRFK